MAAKRQGKQKLTAKADNCSVKELRFANVFDGNATEAARLAGYKGDDNVLAGIGYENLRKPKIQAIIEAREKSLLSALIAGRAERQEFWTRTLRSKSVEISQRLKASELLGKSEADFTEKVKVTGRLTLEDLVMGSMSPISESDIPEGED